MPAMRSRRRDGEITTETKQEGIGVTSAKYLPGARIVRAFNSMSYRFFASEANRPGERMAIPIAGDDKDALRIASTLVHDAGFEAGRDRAAGPRQGFCAGRAAL